MRLHYLQHAPFEGLGTIESWAVSRRHDLTATRFHANESLPPVDQIDWLIVMGGPMSVHDEDRFPWLKGEKRFIERAIAKGKRVLGVCLGAQLLAHVLGADVYPNVSREIGWFPVEMTDRGKGHRLFGSFPARLEVFHWHGETFRLPAGAMHVASSEACPIQAFAYGGIVVGLQFHMEMTGAGIADMVRHCAADLTPGPSVQPASEILGHTGSLGQMGTLLETVLAGMEQGATGSR